MDSALKIRQITIKIAPLVGLRGNATAKSMKITFFLKLSAFFREDRGERV
tara:strand:+ start:320 stop:469 length:150 start_codon:yes stop_codon:yes gene_type:complete